MQFDAYGSAVWDKCFGVSLALGDRRTRLMLLEHVLRRNRIEVLWWHHGLIGGDEVVWVGKVHGPEIHIGVDESGIIDRIGNRIEEGDA